MEELLEILMKKLEKEKRATINVKVEGIRSEILLKGDVIGILRAITVIIQSARTKIRELGADEERTNEFLKLALKKGMEDIYE